MNRFIILLLAFVLILSGCNTDSGESASETKETSGVETTPGETTGLLDTSDPLDTTEAQTTTEAVDTTAETTEVQITTTPETTEEAVTTPTPLPEPIPGTISDAIFAISAANAFVYNVNSDELLAKKGDGLNFSPASITKLLTALYALETAPSDLVISPKAEELSLVGKNSSIAYIKTHHKLTVSQLIQGMMMPSGNDAAYALAAGVGRHIAGDQSMNGKDAVSLFVKGLNEYAIKIGCTGTHFTVPDGLAGSEHYTSSHDMIIIGKLAINNPIIAKYAKTVSQKVYYASGHSITWNNTNSLINPNSEYYSPYVNGLKTGSLTGNYCLYVSAVINENTYLIGIFGAPTKSGRYDDAHILIDAILESVKEAGE